MRIDLPTLTRIVRTPNSRQLAIVQRHYCTQMYLNNLCTAHCLEQCSQPLRGAFELSQGEFVLNPYGALVVALRMAVHGAINQSCKSRAETPKNEFGEAVPMINVFTALAREYEAAFAQRHDPAQTQNEDRQRDLHCQT